MLAGVWLVVFTVISASIPSVLPELHVGCAINIFSRFGYMGISMRVVPRNDSDRSWIFREPTADIFRNISAKQRMDKSVEVLVQEISSRTLLLQRKIAEGAGLKSHFLTASPSQPSGSNNGEQGVSLSLAKAFSSKRASLVRQNPAKKLKIDDSEFTIDQIVLLISKNICRPIEKDVFQFHAENNCVATLVSFNRSMTELDIRQIIRNEFDSLLNDPYEFQILRMENRTLLPLNISKKNSLNGQALWKLFQKKKIYIRPQQNLSLYPKLCAAVNVNFDSDSESDCYESDSGSKKDVVKKRSFGAAEGNLPMNSPLQFSNNEESSSRINSPEIHGIETFNVDTTSNFDYQSTLTIKEVLKPLQTQLKPNKSRWYVNRNNVLNCAFRQMRRKTFQLTERVSIKFTDTLGVSNVGGEETQINLAQELDPTSSLSQGFEEEGVDLGGLSREFFTLCLRSLQASKMFCGPQDQMQLQSDAAAEQVPKNRNELSKNCYTLAGELIALSILQSGPAPCFLSKALYDAVLEGKIMKGSKDLIGDPCILQELNLIEKAQNLEELRDAVLGRKCEEARLTTFPTNVRQKSQLIEQFLDFHGKKRLEYALKSFCEGLSAYGLLTTMGNHPSVFRDLMCAVNDPLTPEKFLKLFTIVRSTPASNRFNLESDILQLFTDFLTDCHDKNTLLPVDDEEPDNEEPDTSLPKTPKHVSLEDVLFFATGVYREPPLGFTSPKIRFHHDDLTVPENERKKFVLPKADTCVITLTLPTMHTDPNDFNEYMIKGISWARGFGEM